jgi:hypothetical protein
MRKTKLLHSLLLLTGLMTALPAMAYDQGFSGTLGSKMDAMLKRKSPPRVYIMEPAISVRAHSMTASGTNYSQPLASMLESELTSQDNRLKPEPHRPETIISCEITRLESADKWEQRQSRESRKTGERQEWNAKKQQYETKPVYQEVEVTRNYKVVSGAINVSYQVKSVQTGLVLDSDTFPVNYLQEFVDGNGAPSSSDVENLLVRRVVAMIVPRLVPTEQVVKVLLAQKDLKNMSKLGEAGLWQKMVEALEMREPFKQPKDDAYRLYNIGVGYEALAYQAEDLATTRKFLDKASALYNQAIEMKPDEKYFREPQKRIESAILQYKKLEDQRAAYAQAKALKEQQAAVQQAKAQEAVMHPSSEPPGTRGNLQGDKGLKANGRSSSQEPKGDKLLTNQGVIDLANQGLDEANLIDTIKQATVVQFDLQPDAMANLLQNKISNGVIAAMRSRQAGLKPASRRPRAKRN